MSVITALKIALVNNQFSRIRCVAIRYDLIPDGPRGKNSIVTFLKIGKLTLHNWYRLS